MIETKTTELIMVIRSKEWTRNTGITETKFSICLYSVLLYSVKSEYHKSIQLLFGNYGSFIAKNREKWSPLVLVRTLYVYRSKIVSRVMV